MLWKKEPWVRDVVNVLEVGTHVLDEARGLFQSGRLLVLESEEVTKVVVFDVTKTGERYGEPANRVGEPEKGPCCNTK